MLYDPEIPDDEGEPAEAFIPLAALVVLPRSERVVMLGEVPAAQVAVLVRAGDCVDRRHVPWDTDDAAAFRTEISWSIMPG